MNSRFTCPTCGEKLAMEFHPAKSPKNPTPYVILHCASRQCKDTAACDDGGSGPTESDAYRSLTIAIDTEKEREAEPWDGISDEEIKDRMADKTADHDRKRAIGL